MNKVLGLILIFVSTACFAAEADVPIEIQTAIETAEEYEKNCKLHEFHQFRENKVPDVELESYLKIKDICPAYNLASTLKTVQNINKLEKQNIAIVSKLPEAEKAKRIESRLAFLTGTIINKPLTLAENLMILVVLQNYIKESQALNNKALNELLSKQLETIKSNRVQIFQNTVKHDILMLLAEYKNFKDVEPKEAKGYKKFFTEFVVYSNELKKNLTCVSAQTCKICGNSFEIKCSKESKKLKTDSDIKLIQQRYAESVTNFFKRVNRF